MVTIYTDMFHLNVTETVVTPFRLSSRFRYQPLFLPRSTSLRKAAADLMVCFVRGTSFADLRKAASARSSKLPSSALPADVP